MKILADYEFYTEDYSGTMSEDEFNRSILSASQIIHKATFKRSETSDADELPYCVCEIADVLNATIYASSGSGKSPRKASENIDGYSVSYVAEMTAGETTEDYAARKAQSIIRKWLDGTGLLYLGG